MVGESKLTLKDMFLLLSGVLLGFLLQLLYDAFREEPFYQNIMPTSYWRSILAIVCAILIVLLLNHTLRQSMKKKNSLKEEKKEEQKEKPIKLKTTDYEPLSALLDFYSDRAVAHASFLVACIFGLFTLLSFMQRADTIPKVCYFFVYLILLGGGGYVLLKFGHHANKAEKIQHAIHVAKKPLLETIFGKPTEKTGFIGAILSVYSKIDRYPQKLTLMIGLYLIVGTLPLIFTLLQFNSS